MHPTPCIVEKMIREQLENLCRIQCKHSTVRTSCDVDLTLSPKTPKSEHLRGVCQGETKSTEHQPRDWKGCCFLGPPWAAGNTPTPSSREKMEHKEGPCAKSGVGQGLGGHTWQWIWIKRGLGPWSHSCRPHLHSISVLKDRGLIHQSLEPGVQGQR